MELGIYYVRLIEHERFFLDENPLKINSLEKLQRLLSRPIHEGPSN